MNLTGDQKKTVAAAFLGWMLDAFDFFLLTFLLKDIAKEFGVEISAVAYALFLTLAMRFVGAFIFGRLGDRWGRKPALMLDILLYSIFGALAAFSPNLIVFLILRALFGVAMGGEWGLGSSLAMESIPPQARGMVSGILNADIRPASCSRRSPTGCSSAARSATTRLAGGRCSCSASCPPSSCCSFAAACPKSPAFEASKVHAKPHLWATITEHKGLVIYMVVLMMCFNLFSHGTQDLYPTFLQKQHNFDPATVSWIIIVANLGAIAGGLTFGHFSEKIGRVNAITIAAIIALPALYLWAFSATPVLLAIGAFIMQVAVQGAWGVIPAHLNELAPGAARATIPAFVYQAGNFLASYNGPLQAQIAEANGGNYALALALVAGVVAVAIVICIRFSPERRGEILKAH